MLTNFKFLHYSKIILYRFFSYIKASGLIFTTGKSVLNLVSIYIPVFLLARIFYSSNIIFAFYYL